MVHRNVPLVEQVIFELLSSVDRGEFVRSNGMLPSEAELAQQFSVSRATVRDALSRLEATGVVIRRQGVGTFVNQFLSRHPAALQDWFEEAHGFVDALRSMGRNPEVQVLRSVVEPAAEAAPHLHVLPEDPVVIVEKVIVAADVPLIHSLNAVPLALLPTDAQLRGAELAGACDSTFRFLEEHCHCRVHHQQSEIRAVATDERLANLLACRPGEPCLQVEEVAYSADLGALFYGLNHFRGDTVSFRQIRRPTLNLTNVSG
ncbi:MAG: GntR family transcriptional regulator [Nitrososphaerales archaeon]